MISIYLPGWGDQRPYADTESLDYLSVPNYGLLTSRYIQVNDCRLSVLT